jgi:DNA-binding GntR family transcriptional regulator
MRKTRAPQRATQYQKLYETLRKQIVEGIYGPGDLLPSESELKAAHHLSQPTVRKAVELLEQEGFVEKKQGKGSIVQTRPVGVGIVSIQGDIFTSQSDSKRIETKIITPPHIIRSVPESFGFAPEETESPNGFYFLERQRSIDTHVIFFEQLCIPNISLERFRQLKLENNSLYDTLFRQYNIMTIASEQRFWAVNSDDTLATQLGIEAGEPVQRLQRRFTTNRLNFFIYSNLSANTGNIYLFSHSTK